MSGGWWLLLGLLLGIIIGLVALLSVGTRELRRLQARRACVLCVRHAAEQRIQRLCDAGLDAMLAEMLRELDETPPRPQLRGDDAA